MLDKQIMRKVFDDNFNIINMRNQILLKSERKDNVMNRFFKLAIPVCLVVIMCSVIYFGYDNVDLKTNDNIYVNNLEDVLQKDMVFEVEEIDFESIPNKFNFILDVNISKTFKLVRKYNLYTRSNLEVNAFDILRDYVFEYTNENGGQIIISFSEIGKPLRDYYIIDGKSSKINDIDVIIAQYENTFMVTFEYNNIFFDIETNNITIEELKSLLKSIVK